ncbi:hypothetical protein CIPAW_05G135400 [Carya illinoinensis]|uniref:Uncharacterized protein n=1 Tax=Carya illinoinensis TaxID=32201 RepID=A0A8T1QHY9_CARIL|nr:hypothetical protein CIPAW_05G135400 [Carya illinoinensis]
MQTAHSRHHLINIFLLSLLFSPCQFVSSLISFFLINSKCLYKLLCRCALRQPSPMPLIVWLAFFLCITSKTDAII